MKKSAYSVAVLGAAISVMAVCYGPRRESCPGYVPQWCPDNSGHLTKYCTTSDEKDSNRTTSSGAYGLSSTNGTCKYECFYYVYENGQQVSVGCGNVTNNWSGSVPNGTSGCVDNGTGTGTGTGSQ